jgi:hypothetical protein
MQTKRVGKLVFALALITDGAAAQAATSQPDRPALLKDVNSLSDGHGVIPPADDPTVYPLTASSFPESPYVANDRLFFLAHDATGQRDLYRYDPAAAAKVNQVSLTGPGPHNPRNLTVFGSALYCIADLIQVDPKTLAVLKIPKVYQVADWNSVLEVPFDSSPALQAIDGMMATASRLTVLTVVNNVHQLWHLTSDHFSAGLAAAVRYSNPANLTAWGDDRFVFSAADQANPNRRLLVVDSVSFTSVAASNPTQLLAVGTKMVFVNMTSGDDTLSSLDGTTTSALATGTGIHSLTRATIELDQVACCIANSETTTPILACWDNKRGYKMPRPADTNTSLVSVAALATSGDSLYVLGVARDDLGQTTTLWQLTADANHALVLQTQHAFPDCTAAHDLHLFGTSQPPRAVFTAWATNQSSRCPRLVASRSGSGFSQWDCVDVCQLVAGSSPELLRRVGTQLFFRATHVSAGSEPWSWTIPGL